MYSDYINVRKGFQSSVNLELDLFNEQKIDEYIPTSDICDVLKRYILVALNEKQDKATTLIGPYGKGKSFLLLVLTYILGPNKETKTYDSLLQRIRKIDNELYLLIERIRQQKITLLPIIINSNYHDLTQSFQIALNDALQNAHLDKIVPKTAFDICIDLITKWESSEETQKAVLAKCLEINKVDIKKLKERLKKYDQAAYEQFKKLYNCVNIGLEFNPLVSADIIKTYSDTAIALSKEGYTGLFIVFDEFSKFIESNSANLMKDLKIVQDMAELALRSNKKAQIHFCCVAHKSLNLYNASKTRQSYADSFKTVEGRFKEIRFNRSLEENYQIIAYALDKKPDAVKLARENLQKRKDFYNLVKNSEIFGRDFDEECLFLDCFPLNPLTVFALIQISELAAQNERTLFTFISDTDDDSFNSFLHSNKEGLFNIDKIYDYFSPILKREDLGEIRNIWYRAESILSKTEEITARRLIKALAIILIINDPDRLPPSEETLSIALDEKIGNINKSVQNLLDNHLLRKSPLNSLLSFALSNTKQIDESIEYLSKTKFRNVDYAVLADQLNQHRYFIPRKYDEENKIKRFFKTAFLQEKDFLAINSFEYYFQENFCDGLVVYLLQSKLTEEEIREKINAINDPRIVVKAPSQKISDVFYQSLLRVACLQEISSQKGLDEITQTEIALLLEETKNDIITLLEETFENSSKIYSCVGQKETTFQRALSASMDCVYSKPLIFNNELINKKNVSTQYQKAINHVIDWLLSGSDDFPYSPTSPESSIKISVLDENDDLNNDSKRSAEFRELLNIIKNQIINSNGKRIPLIEMVEPLIKPPFGIRLGVIPLIFAKAISEMSDNILLYFSAKEIELDSTNLVKAIQNPSKYFISFSKGSNEQKSYLNSMLKLFSIKSTESFRRDTLLLSTALRRYFVGLPQIIRLVTEADNYLMIPNTVIRHKNLFLSFNINPYESIFEKPKEIYETSNYKELYKRQQDVIKSSEHMLDEYKKTIVQIVKTTFGLLKNESLKSGLDDLIKTIISDNEDVLLEDTSKKILRVIKEKITYDDFEAVNQLSKAITGQSIEDWDTDKREAFRSALISFNEQLRTAVKYVKTDNPLQTIVDGSNTEMSEMAVLLKNNISSVVDEFSDSLTTAEKIAVLSSLLKEML